MELCQVLLGDHMLGDQCNFIGFFKVIIALPFRKWKVQNQVANLGQCFIAIDPAAFTDDFNGRMQSLMDTCRGLSPLDPELPVLIPGDR